MGNNSGINVEVVNHLGEHKIITTNGSAVFYATIWPAILKKCLENGWSDGLQGSLNSDMDILIMPGPEAINCDKLMLEICSMLDIPFPPLCKEIKRPHGRISYTIPLTKEVYFDIQVIRYDPDGKGLFDPDQSVSHI